MALQIRRALGNGVTKTLSTAGFVFMILLALVEIVFLASTNTLTEAFLASLDLPAGATQSSTSVPLSLPVSATVAAVIGFIGFLVLQLLLIVLIRVMTAENQTITRESYTRRMGWVFINSIVGGIVVGFLTMIGFILLVIPGLFLTVSLLFTTVYIADEDEGFISAIRDSWRLTAGNRWRLFGLYLAIIILSMVISVVPGLALPSGSALSLIVSTILTTVLIVYMMAVLTDAYRQLRDENQPGHGASPHPDAADM